ncbi:MAG: DUF4416 family protein [Candidatus Omnitrophota bacterium]
MGQVKRIQTVKLICGLISVDAALFQRSAKLLSGKFGAIDYKSPIFDFDFTDYYKEEMGTNLKRQFLSFSRLINPELLPKIKLYTNKIEAKFARNNKRTVNIDPGYITAAKLILATTKDYSHRIYLNRGIYAEITLTYRGDSFTQGELTFPDYRTEHYIETFNKIRRIYMGQIKL